MEPQTTDRNALRGQALDRIERRRSFYTQLAGTLAVDVFMVVIWAITGGGFFWPGFVLAASVVSLGPRAWSVFGDRPPTEAEIEAEEQRLRDR